MKNSSKYLLIIILLINLPLFALIYLFDLNEENKILIKLSNVNLIHIFNKDLTNSVGQSPSWEILKGLDGNPCYANNNIIKNCSFKNKNSDIHYFLVGGSQAATLGYDLKNKLKKDNFYQFTHGLFFYLPNFKMKDFNTGEIYFDKLDLSNSIKEKILNTEGKKIVILSSRYSLLMNDSWFNNSEGGVEGGKLNIGFMPNNGVDYIKGTIQELNELIQNDIFLVLIYPIPEVGWHVRKNMFQNYKFFSQPLSTSYNVYKTRNQKHIDLLDSIQGKNVFRVYPENFFCDNNVKKRCITHEPYNILKEDIDVYYYDDDHPSLKGAEIINDLIMQEIEKIK